MSAITIVAAAMTLIAIMAVGVYSGRSVKSAADFDTGGKNAGTIMVAGTILGTLVGGSATIGTAQLAFNFGLSAWWFTLGSAIGCLVLGLLLCGPLRESESLTIQEMVRKEYGATAGVITSVLATAGIMLNIVSQILSANALLSTMFGWGPLPCAAVSIVIMACYIVFGGVKGAGLLGVVKLTLIYLTVVVCGVLAMVLSGGIGAVRDILPAEQYFSLFARGLSVDLGAGMSVVLGVVASQTYVQAIIMGKDNRSARNGALISAALTPLVGLLAIFVGYYMRIQFPGMDAAGALPQFILSYTPDLFAGIALATLLIAVVGTGSGMALGFGTIVTNDIYKRFINKSPSDRRALMVSRGTILTVLVVSAAFTMGNMGSAILTWGFLSMGLRAVVLVAPMFGALFLKGRVDRRFAAGSSVFGFALMVVANFLNPPIDPLFIGIIGSFICLAVGLCTKRPDQPVTTGVGSTQDDSK